MTVPDYQRDRARNALVIDVVLHDCADALQPFCRQPDRFGLTRGEILERMGMKGDKSGEMSVSNAVTALTKANQVIR